MASPRRVLLLILLAASAARAEEPRRAPTLRVVVDAVEVHDEPSATSYVSGELARGAVVEPVGAVGPEWVAIRPPDEVTEWADESSLLVHGSGVFEVRPGGAVVRSGRRDALLPGPALARHAEGTRLRGLEAPALRVRTRTGERTYRAVRPIEGAVRYIPSWAVRAEPEPPSPPPPLAIESPPVLDSEVQTAQVEPPPEIAEDLIGIDATIRAILLGPIEGWAFEPVRARCVTLLEQNPAPESRAAIQARLTRIESLADLSEAGRRFRELLGRSRQRDQAAAVVRGRDRSEPEPFDDQGLLQSSSRMVEGQFVSALIGGDGRLRAYLDIPPGLDGSRFLGKRVGVRGPSRYDENLRAPLIRVRDVELLERVP